MKFSCYKQDFASALASIMFAVANKPMAPILSGVLINAKSNRIELQANNHGSGARVVIPASVIEDGATVVTAKRLQDFIKNLPEDTVEVSLEDNELNLLSGGAAVSLLTYNAAEFPTVKDVAIVRTSLDVNAAQFKANVAKVIFAVGKDESRPIFTGVNFEFKGGKLNLVATNTHRLARASMSIDADIPDFQVVVPVNALRGVVDKINPADTDNNLRINFAERFVSFQFDNIFITSRIIEGQFPPYERVFPKDITTDCTVNVKDLLNAVNFIALMAKENEYNTVKLRLDASGIEVAANAQEIGGAVTNVSADIDGASLDVAFNAYYLIDYLKICGVPVVHIGFGDRYSPAKFDSTDTDYIYIATPVRA